MKVNILANALKTIMNAERKGQRQVLLRPSSKVLIKFLKLMQKRGYIGEFEVIDDHRSGKIVVELLGRINKCGVISPRFDVKINKIERWVTNVLPARQFGFIVLSTTYGVLDHTQAIHKHTGGKVVGFFY